jgi:predicted  nucleic acid-binding Zn-ribbon protein
MVGEEMHESHTCHTVHGHPHKDMIHGMCGCGCGGRRFLSRKEKIELLEEYRESLKKELEGVEEELKELKS